MITIAIAICYCYLLMLVLLLSLTENCEAGTYLEDPSLDNVEAFSQRKINLEVLNWRTWPHLADPTIPFGA